MSSAGSLATLALCFGSTFVAGHMIMQNPVPFGKETLNNSPLVDTAIGSSQSDFPCKQRAGVYKIDTINKYQVESPIELNFTGSASHGGGTCQISITRDLEPTAKSDFRVIQTFSGGCPTAQDGNSGSTDFSFKIPKGFPNGRATLAWTWYNKIGNREIYMNCAPLDISGGSSDTTVYDSLPHMYVINLPSSGGSDYCKSADSADVLIPDPGQYNTKAPTAKLEAPTGPGCAAAAKAATNGVSSGSGSSGPSGSAGSSAPSAGGNQSAAPSSGDGQAPASSSPSQPSASSDSAASQSGFATVTTVGSGAASSESAASTPAESSSYPTMSVPSDAGVSGPASTGFAAAPTGTGSSSSGSGSSGGSDGSLVCNGTDQFGLMNNGKVVWQPVAAGTKCVNGQIQKRSDSRHAHVRRHAAKDF